MTGSSPSIPSDLESLLLDQVDAAIVVTDVDGVVVRWNRGAERLYGWSQEEALGRHVLDLKTGDGDRSAADRVLQRLRAGETWDGELWLTRKDGSRVAVRVRDAPLLATDGSRIGIVGVVRGRHRAPRR